MATVLEEIKESALSLTERERIALAGALLKSVPGELADSATEIQEASEKEISRRIAEIDSGAVEGFPLEDVIAEIDKKHGWKS